jgi:hypothetical protein
VSRSQPIDKDEKLEGALSALAIHEEAFEAACVEYAIAESDYRIKFARKFLEADGTEKARHSTAIVDVEKELRERDRSEAVKEFTKEKLRDAQAVVSARQSLLYADVKTNAAVR